MIKVSKIFVPIFFKYRTVLEKFQDIVIFNCVIYGVWTCISPKKLFSSFFIMVILGMCYCNISSSFAKMPDFYTPITGRIMVWRCCLHVHPSVHLSVCPVCLSVRPSIHPSLCPSVHLSFHCVCLSIHLAVCPSVRPSISLSVGPTVRPSVCLPAHLSVRLCPSICLSVCTHDFSLLFWWCYCSFNCVWSMLMFSLLVVLFNVFFILPFYCTTLFVSCCEMFLQGHLF